MVAEAMEAMEVSVVGPRWSLPLLHPVSVEADGGKSLTPVTEAMEVSEAAEVADVTVVETLWPMPLRLWLCVRKQTEGGD